MIKILVKHFIKNYKDTKDTKVREQYGVLGGVLGIICNILLFAVKLFVGLLLNAISVISDAFNNLTDSFSSIVSIISAKLSNKKPDKDHPFGHGRIEYISTLIVSFIIVLVGFELLTSSIENLINGIKGDVTPLASGTMLYVSMGILAASLLVKLWMYSYNKYLGKMIDSSVLLASAADSISDVLTSFAIIVATLLGGLLLKNYYFYLDSAMGIIVAIIICINGLKIVLSTIGDLLGKPANKEELEALEKIILSSDKILGIHDLIIHDYGPGRKYASVHAEVDANSNIVEAHEIIDNIEQICYAQTSIELTIHMDPIDFSSENVKEANKVVDCVIKTYKDITYHDLRITNGEQNINVIFDLVIPHRYDNEQIKDIINNVKNSIKSINNKYSVVIKIDRPFI